MKRLLLLPLLALAASAAAATNAPPEEEKHSVETIETDWTPVLLQLGWKGEDEFASSNPPPNVYGLALGLASVAANDVVGVDMALGMPFTRDSVWGVQAGLFGTFICGSLNGIQVGGVFAGSKRVSGVSIGGLMTVTERLDGIALGGLYAGAETGSGIVASFGFTETGNAAALANAPSRPFTGIQIAGLANFGSDITGVQIAPFFNFAGELHGLQVGLVNKAFSGCGVQIGLFNFFGRNEDTLFHPLINARF